MPRCPSTPWTLDIKSAADLPATATATEQSIMARSEQPDRTKYRLQPRADGGVGGWERLAEKGIINIAVLVSVATREVDCDESTRNQ